MNRLIASIALWLVCVVVYAAQPADTSTMNFINRRGDKLFDGAQEFRYISFNIPNLMVQEDAYEFTSPNPWRWPNEFEIEDALESVRQMGGQVVRTYVLSVHRNGSDMGDLVHVRKPGEFNEEGFRALDKVIEVARQKKIRIIIPFVDQSKWWGGIGEYAAFRGKPAEAFWSDPQIIDDFKTTIHYLLTRKNVYTGVEYRDELAIFGWETGNEIMPSPEWTREIAAYIKHLDKKHLVLDGKSLHGFPVASLDDPNIDVISTHHYPFGENHDFSKPIREAYALTKGKKAYMVGEFGFVETPHIASAIQTVIDEGASGALLWSLRMHRREGGFYWHMEVGTGQNIYKAFHWPGFDSGERYDERAVLALVRNKAYEIRGMKPPAIERPAPPRLLPIAKVSAISWQGAAGASGYDIWRASAADGPWQKIAADVSDADVQYRPLFHDDQAEPGQRYWYRVVARNAAGESEPSNVVGPVTTRCRTLVDECRDLSLAASTAGSVAKASESVRTVQEDCQRLVLDPGAAVTYRADGPISRWKVYSFAPNKAGLTLAVSSDGRKFRPVTPKVQTFSSGRTVYGYLTPTLFSGTTQGEAKFLRITAENAERTTSKETEGKKTAPQKARVELSRVEIEYDPVVPSAEAVQLNSSIFVDSSRRIDSTLAAIDDAAKHGERQLNVVVSVLVDLTDDLHVKSFGFFSGRRSSSQPYNDAMREELKNNLRQVFARMVRHNMSIYVLPHIDAGGEVQEWRNWVNFDPLDKYGRYSYNDLVLGTIADALAETVKPTTHVELALSGEMGTSLFRYPAAYRAIARRLRERPQLRQLKIGISLNHNGIAGSGNPSRENDIQLTGEQRKQMQMLIDECDFVGMSFYAPVSVSPTALDFVRGIDRFMNEFHQLGLHVSTTKPMQFSEVGIGGRQAHDGKVDLDKAVEAPWEGTANPRRNPWTNDAMRALRRQYHSALLDFLTTQLAKWRVSAAFLWSTGSWDPWGHGQSEFADPAIENKIETHNRAVGEN